jgi:hypothetical protein
MLRSIKETLGYRIEATDGLLGHAKDFLFDNHSWSVRYLVVDTGDLLVDRKVLLSPQAMREPSWAKETLPVGLTRQQVENSPPLESDMPISRAHEQQLAEYYSWQAYWQWPLPMSSPVAPVPIAAGAAVAEAEKDQPAGNPNLRSVREVIGYRIHATDGEVGHVSDYLVQTDGWVIRYLVLDTRKVLPGRKVLISPAWVTSVDWEKREVRVDLTSEEVRGSLPYDPSAPVNREYEVRLYDYLGRPKYWEPEGAPTDVGAMTGGGHG